MSDKKQIKDENLTDIVGGDSASVYANLSASLTIPDPDAIAVLKSTITTDMTGSALNS